MAIAPDALEPLDPAAEAQAARESAAVRLAGRARRMPPAVPATPELAPPVDDNPYSSFRTDDDAGEAGLRERARLNAIDSYYRGSLAGAGRLQALSSVAFGESPDDTPEFREQRKQARTEYEAVIADLGRYDLMRPFGTTLEATVALGGQFGGALLSPESFLGWAGKGASVIVRAAKTGLQQAGIQLGTDPVVQSLSISSGVQKEYEPLRTALAPAIGFAIGGGLHLGVEGVGRGVNALLSGSEIRRTLADVATEDPQMRGAASELPPGEARDAPSAPTIDDLRARVGELDAEYAALERENRALFSTSPNDPARDVILENMERVWAARSAIFDDIHRLTPPSARGEAADAQPTAGMATVDTVFEGVAGRVPNQWFEFPEGRMYVKRGERPDYGPTLELANLGIDEASRGQGVFTRYLEEFERKAGQHGYEHVYIEAVIEPRFRQFFERRGYRMVPGTDQTGYPDYVKRTPAPVSAEPAATATRQAVERPESVPAHDPTAAPARQGEVAGVFLFDASNLATDAKRFQYKEGGDAEGVTTALKSVTKWDPAKANQLIVWEDESGKLFVADGHQRSGLARRLIAEGREADIRIPGLLYRAKDGFAAEDVRAIAAAKNIAEGSGSALDAAKVLRSRPDLLDGSIPLSRTIARQGADLAKLADEPFGMVVNEVVPENYGALVGRYIPDDPARQTAAMKALARFKPDNETEAAILVQRVAEAELAKAEAGRQGGLFGDDFESADSTVGEEMRIVARVIADLKKDKTLFARVIANAERIEETGSSIHRESARAVAQDAELFARSIASDAFSAGPVRTALVAAAKEVKNGAKSIADAAADVLLAARREAEKNVPGGHRDRGSGTPGEDGGNDLLGIRTITRLRKRGPNLIEQRELDGQDRLPGLEPSTLKQQLDLEADRPLRGGDAPPGGLFGDDSKQKDLFGLAQRRSGGAPLAMERARPDTGTPAPTGTAVTTVPNTPSPPQAAAIRSLQQQAVDLAQALDFPLREGRVEMRGALGTFNRRSGVVRVKEVPDFEVVVHEAGHALEAKVGRELTDLTDAYAGELGPLDYDQNLQRTNEGFAEFIRRYIGNPAHVAQIAPGFTRAFRDFMGQHQPELLASLDRAGAGYRAYIQAPSVDAVGAVRRSTDETPRGFRKVVEAIRTDGFAATVKHVVQRSYQHVADRANPVHQAVRELGAIIREQKGGQLVELKAADNPEVLLRLAARTEQAGVLDMTDGVRPYHSVTPEGPSLSAALATAIGQPTVMGRWDDVKRADFSSYLIARRAEYLWRKFEDGKLQNPPAAFSKGDAVVALAELERANPSFRQGSDLVHDYSRQLLRKMFDGGLIDADLYGRLTAEEFYVPFLRDLSDKPKSSDGMGAQPDRRAAATVVQRMTGSARDIKDPIESLMLQTFLVNRTLRHNDIIRSFVNLGREAKGEGGRYVEAIPAKEAKRYTFDLKDAIERKAREKGMDADESRAFAATIADYFGEDPLVGSFFRMEPAGKRGEPIVFYKEGGELRAARFMSGEEGHALYETLTALPSGLADLSLQVLAVSSSVLRSGIVTNPVYALTNYIRDQLAAGILRPDYIPFVSGWRGIRDEVMQGESAKLYGYSGGVSAGASIAPLQQAAEANVQALARQGYLVNRLTSLHGLLELGSVTEAGTRNSIFAKVYEQKRNQGLSDYEAMIEAAYAGQDIMDFSRWGDKTLALRAVTPFVNAHIQGLDKAYRTLVQPLIREAVFADDVAKRRNALVALTKVFAVGGALGAAWAALHHADEVYQDAKPELKGTHFVTTIGGKVFVIPKPFELSLGFTAGEFAFQRLRQEDPRAAAQFAEAAFEVLKPPVPFFDNPALKTSFELLTGKALFPSIFSPRDIVPGALQRLDARQQYTDRTTSLAKAIGNAIGASPIKVDYAVGAYFGLWGRDIMALSSGVDENAPAQSWEDVALVRRFLKDPTRSSDVTTKYWSFMGQTTGRFNQAVASYDDLVKKFRDAEAAEFLSKLPAAERAFVILRSAANEDGKAAFGPNEKRLHPLQRAYDAVTLLNGVRRELADNAFKRIEGGENVKLDPVMRRDLIGAVRELAQTEMRNSFVTTKEPGYANRPLFDLAPVMAKIRALSPAVADELATRYATQRIYSTAAVAKAWPAASARLLRDGSGADLGDLVDAATDNGVEFGAERVRRPQKRRVPIAPTPAAPMP